jgi:Family of unknown function (DUF5681)
MGNKTIKRRRRRSAGACPDPSNETLDAQNGNDYQIGYGRPPQNTQFRPGQSGNPKGRPRGSKNLATLIEEELSAKVAVNEGGKRRILPKRVVIAKRFVNKAAEGDIRTLQTLFKVTDLALAEPERAATESEPEKLGADDRAILKAFETKLIEATTQAAPDAKSTRSRNHPIRKRRKQ